jgi:hypothetical protein
VVAIDGSTIDLQPAPELEHAFGGPISNDSKRTGWPQARMVTLIECGTRALLDAVLDHYAQGENTLAARLVRSITPGMLLLADRGFPSRQLWTLFTKAGADLVWRAKTPIAKRVIQHLPDGSYLAHFGKGRAVTVRVIEYKLQGSARVYRLLTNMLDPQVAPPLELAAIYAERWEVEILLKEIKACQCSSRPLRSQTELGVRQEFWAHCVLHQVSRQLAYQAASTIPERDPDRISFSLVQDVILRSTAWVSWLIARRLKAVLHHVIHELTTTKALIDRSDRVCPRVVRRKWSKYRPRTHSPSPSSTRRRRRPGIILCAA